MGHHTTLPSTTNLTREIRDELLKASDWTQMPDSPLSDTKKTEWATYRQKLRDMMASITDETAYDSIQWPTRPE